MFRLTSESVFESPLLLTIPGIRHGFASRAAESWPAEYTAVRQVHSAEVLQAEGKSGLIGSADGLVTNEPGQWIGVRTADCVPVLIAHTKGAAIAAVHAGWRGTADWIVRRAVEKLTEAYGCRASELAAAIGPCIGKCCYEVGAEVSHRFRQLFPEERDLSRIDLAEANRRQLIEAGLCDDLIDVSRLCTKCHPESLHSYRRDKDQSGRMVSAIRIGA